MQVSAKVTWDLITACRGWLRQHWADPVVGGQLEAVQSPVWVCRSWPEVAQGHLARVYPVEGGTGLDLATLHQLEAVWGPDMSGWGQTEVTQGLIQEYEAEWMWCGA